MFKLEGGEDINFNLISGLFFAFSRKAPIDGDSPFGMGEKSEMENKSLKDMFCSFWKIFERNERIFGMGVQKDILCSFEIN